MSESQLKLNVDSSVGPKPIGSVATSDEDAPDEYLGHFTFSTTGDADVPIDWLHEQFIENGLNEGLLPRRPSNWQAYRRAMRSLSEDSDLLEYSVFMDDIQREIDCRIELEKSQEKGSNVFITYTRMFWPEELSGEEGGDYDDERLGYFDFHRPDEGPGGLIRKSEIDQDNAHYEEWCKIIDEARERYSDFQNVYLQQDLQSVLTSFRSAADAIAIRRGVYFVGNHHQASVEALSRIWGKMNAFKDSGDVVRIDTTPVLNLEEQREIIAVRVEEKLENMVDVVVTEAFSEWEDSEEQTADAAAREIMNKLENADKVAGKYSELLSIKLSIKNILRERMDEFSEEKEDIVQQVLDQRTLEDV